MDFLILSLAVWRISSLLVSEDGPWDFFAKLRHLVGVRYDAYSTPYGTGTLGMLFSCVWCMSVWVGGIVGLLYLWENEVTVHLALLPALSGAAIVIQTIVGKN